MSIWQKACETYDAHACLAGLEIEGKRQALTPLYHMIVNAHLELTITADGAYVSAEFVPKAGAKTVIPATIASSIRTNGVAPHPLCDQLRYVARFGGDKYDAYVQLLQEWEGSRFTNPKLTAILKYVVDGTIISDLEADGILTGQDVAKNAKIGGTEAHKLMVRWRVLDTGEETACWKDSELFASFQGFIDSQEIQDSSLCMITGKQDALALLHPKGIVAISNGAKLISSNDSTGFTYRGRFTDPTQAATIGYAASQKVHSALSWLAANQGVIRGNRVFIYWCPSGSPVPDPDNLFEDSDELYVTPSDYKMGLAKALDGCKAFLGDDEDVVFTALEAATTGRLSIVDYGEMKACDFRQRLSNWYDSCCMVNGRFGIQTPRLRRIISYAFGTERNGKFVEVDDQLMSKEYQRLMRCITESAAIPYDVVLALFHKASRPECYKDVKNRRGVLFTACAVIRKFLNDRAQKEEWSMVLDTSKTDRSYLFGRLLAAYEYIERCTYPRGVDREPNAIRLQATFVDRPMHGVQALERKLIPYIQKLSPGMRAWYKSLIAQIMSSFRPEDELDMNKPLEPTYLLGYYMQRNAFYTKRNHDNNNTDNYEEE